MKSIVGIVLIVVAIVAGYQGIQKLDNTGAKIDILGAEISVQDKGSKEQAYIYLGVGVIALLAGLAMLRGKSN